MPTETERLDWLLMMLTQGYEGIKLFNEYVLEVGDGRAVIDGIMAEEREGG